MGKADRREKLEADLLQLQERFERELRSALHSCAAGKWGLFGRNDAVYDRNFSRGVAEKLKSRDAESLLALVSDIDGLRGRLGYVDQFPLCATYLSYRERRMSNDPSEPKLAEEMLAEIESRT